MLRVFSYPGQRKGVLKEVQCRSKGARGAWDCDTYFSSINEACSQNGLLVVMVWKALPSRDKDLLFQGRSIGKLRLCVNCDHLHDDMGKSLHKGVSY